MARSARASVRKINRTNLRSKVFGPVYDARTQRLSAKLMELASQPKAKTEMEVEQPASKQETHTMTTWNCTDASVASQNTIDTEAKETDPVDGEHCSLSIQIPRSVLQCAHVSKSVSDSAAQLPTPPTTPPVLPTFQDPADLHEAAVEQLFYHMLGVAADVHGFDQHGQLSLNVVALAENT